MDEGPSGAAWKLSLTQAKVKRLPNMKVRILKLVIGAELILVVLFNPSVVDPDMEKFTGYYSGICCKSCKISFS